MVNPRVFAMFPPVVSVPGGRGAAAAHLAGLHRGQQRSVQSHAVATGLAAAGGP